MAKEPNKAEARDLDAELEALRAYIEAKEASFKQDTKLRELDSLKAFAQAQDNHEPGTLKLVKLSDGRGVILKRPHRATYKKFSKSKLDYDSQYEYVQPCVVYPDRAEFSKLVDELPGVITSCAGILNKLAELQASELAGE